MITEISTEISSKTDLEVVYDSLNIKNAELLPTIITVTFERKLPNRVHTSVTVTSFDSIRLYKKDVGFNTKLLELIKLILNKNYKLQVEFMPDDKFINLLTNKYKLEFTDNYGSQTIPPKQLYWMDRNMVWVFGIDNNSLAIFRRHSGSWAYFCSRDSDIYIKMHKRLIKETLRRFFTKESFYDKFFRNGLSQ